MNREQTITQLLETMSVAKRSLFTRMQSIAQDSPVSGSHVELLSTIAQMQPISSKQLAAQLQLSPGAISQLVDGLEQHQLIQREAPGKDRRVSYLGVSPTGRALLERISAPRRQVMEELMQQLSDDELTVWLSIQQKMIAQFQLSEPRKQ